MKQVIVITGSVPPECTSIRRMTEVKWSQSSGPGPRGMLRRCALKDRHFVGGRRSEVIRELSGSRRAG